MMKTNLVKTYFKKEKMFWKRKTFEKTRKETSIVVFIIALIFIAIGRIAIISMSFAFECVMWIFNRERFRINLQKLQRN